MLQFRVYDLSANQWVERAFLNQNGIIHKRHGFSGEVNKLPRQGMLVVQPALDTPDIHSTKLFAGDIVRTEGGLEGPIEICDMSAFVRVGGKRITPPDWSKVEKIGTIFDELKNEEEKNAH